MGEGAEWMGGHVELRMLGIWLRIRIHMKLKDDYEVYVSQFVFKCEAMTKLVL